MAENGKTTTMAELKQQQRAPESTLPEVRAGFDSLPAYNLLVRQATGLSQASLVPKQFQNNIPNSIIALELANRMKASPLMVMQNLFVVHGRPGWSSQFLIATFNVCGRFTTMQFRFQGKEGTDEWGCRAFATEIKTDREIVGPPVTIAMAKAEGWYDRRSKDGGVASKWPTMTELMMTYRAAAFFVRIFAPELAMGLTTREEIEDMFPIDAEYTVTTEELRREPAKAPGSHQDATEGAPDQEPGRDESAAEGIDSGGEVGESNAERMAREFDEAEKREQARAEPPKQEELPQITPQKAGKLRQFASDLGVALPDLTTHLKAEYGVDDALLLNEKQYSATRLWLQERRSVKA